MEEKGVVFTRSASGLVRELSGWDVFIMLVATPAASGILYYSVKNLSAYPGASMSLAFLIGMLMFLPIYASIAISAATMPRAGSLYVLVSRLVDPSVAFLGAALFFLGYSLTIGVLGYIVMGIFGGVLITAASASGFLIFKNFGAALQTPLWSTIGGFLWVAFFWYITIAGIKPFRYVLRISFYIPMLATLIGILYFLAISPYKAQQLFDASWGSGIFQGILNLAHKNGWQDPVFSWAATFGVLLVVIWAYGGIEMASYAGGEVKTPRTSLIKGTIWGWFALGLLYVILAWSVQHPFGNFLAAYDFLFKNHQEALKGLMVPITPSVPFYLISIIGNPWLGVALALAMVVWFVNTIPPFFLGISRLIFALAMDRAIPEKLADINQRNGAPTWAAHLTAIFAILGVLLNLLGVEVVLATIGFSVFFIVWLYGLGAMLLPYRRPDIFEKSPVKTKVLGIPLITLLGFLTFGIGWFIIYFTVSQMKLSVFVVIIVMMLISLAVYLLQQTKNISKGVDISTIYSEIPPE